MRTSFVAGGVCLSAALVSAKAACAGLQPGDGLTLKMVAWLADIERLLATPVPGGCSRGSGGILMGDADTSDSDSGL